MMRNYWLAFLLLLPTLSSAQTNPLTFRPSGAEFSAALDRIVMISSNPSQLHIYDPASQTDVAVALSKVPLTVSVSPDGLHAAVMHDLLVSYVNLSTATVEKTFPTTLTNVTVVLGTDWVYLVPISAQYSPNANPTKAGSIKIATGAETDVSSINSSGGRLHPS